ncbi:cysteine hydrolase family protein [Roseovarius atlanticus]|uniref:cysteine hydrolase family protein n=1 Tax=Roseovarius atlanticus TaxID=1641875 RepID=UPI001C96293B|nr:cysteine hydrolase [Roseovarius atlanticus]MBY6126551.1 cysteine hydrolase [Roseovarius atlanticus]MBY6151045.1 cysteine hydrolase [Roseovarius atlanticus]
MMDRDNPALNRLEKQLNPQHSAVAVIDLQNDFVSAKGLLAREKGLDVEPIRPVINAANSLVSLARKSGVRVFWIRVVHTIADSPKNYLEKYLGHLPEDQWTDDKLLAREGSWGAEWDEEILPRLDSEPEILKRNYSGFYGTHFDHMLRAQGVRTLLFAGCNTNVCVQATASDAFYRGYYSIMVEDACASVTPEMNANFIENHKKWFGDTTDIAALRAYWG